MEYRTFVIATHNQNKVREFQRILAPLGITVTTPDLTEAEETGTTFAEMPGSKRTVPAGKPDCPPLPTTPD